MKTQSFRECIVWQKAHRFVLEIYKLTEIFPKSELYGLTSQLRRAAVSVPANFAEGYKRSGLADKIRFFNISQGSLAECDYYLILAQDLNICNTHSCMEQLQEIEIVLNAYIAKIKIRMDESRRDKQVGKSD